MTDHVEKSEPGYKLYTSTQIAAACFFASFLVAGILLSSNYRKLGETGAAVRVLLTGLISTAVLFILAYQMPDDSPGFAIGAISILIAKKWAEVEQGKALAKHLDTGGRQASNWKVAGLSILCLGFLFVTIVGTAIALEPSYQSVNFGKNHVYYLAPVTEAQARSVGDSLENAEFFDNESEADVLLVKENGQCAVRFVVAEVAWTTTEHDEYYHSLRDLLREDLKEPGLRLDFVNPELEIKKTLP